MQHTVHVTAAPGQPMVATCPSCPSWTVSGWDVGTWHAVMDHVDGHDDPPPTPTS